MSDHEVRSFETELRRLKPARAPEAFVYRLQKAVREEPSSSESPPPVPTTASAISVWRVWLKWLVPVAGAVGLTVLLLLLQNKESPVAPTMAHTAAPQVVDEVELDKQLIAAFEGVAQMQGGLPMRFRCYGWQEALTFRNADGAIEVEQRGPRLEIVPVGFDVY